MAAAAIVDFKIFKFLTVGTFKRVKLHHCAKFWHVCCELFNLTDCCHIDCLFLRDVL